MDYNTDEKKKGSSLITGFALAFIIIFLACIIVSTTKDIQAHLKALEPLKELQKYSSTVIKEIRETKINFYIKEAINIIIYIVVLGCLVNTIRKNIK